MRRLSLGLAALVLFGVGACGGDASEPPEAPPEAEAESVEDTPAAAAEAEATPTAAREADLPRAEALPAAPGAPAFAVLYPGAALTPGAENAEPTGPNGAVTYMTAASPQEVVAFYRTRAEAEGLASVMAMNQGAARAYGAHDTDSGANLSVFAAPVEDGGTSVQLVWGLGG